MYDRIQVSAHVQVFCHILLYEFEAIVSQMMLDVCNAAGEQVIKDDRFVPALYKAIHKMRTQKACSACYQNPHF